MTLAELKNLGRMLTAFLASVVPIKSVVYPVA